MKVHFTGIKGVGMAALALAYRDAGWEVTGSDTKEKQITDEPLKNRGIHVVEKFTPRNIWVLKKMVWVPAIDKLIYTGAHHGAQNVEVKWAASRGVPTINYAKALGEFFADKKQICVCGVGGENHDFGDDCDDTSGSRFRAVVDCGNQRNRVFAGGGALGPGGRVGGD